MTTVEIGKYKMLVRVRDFGVAHRELFPARSVAGKLFAAVAAAADALPQHDSTALAGRGGEQEGAVSKAAARLALRRQVRAIARAAWASEEPGLTGRFRASTDGSDQRLLAHARTFLTEAKPFAATFVAHELPVNFLSQLRVAIDAFDRATRDRVSGRDRRREAQARLEASMEDGLRAVRRLSAIVPIRLQDPVEVILWNDARRVEHGRVRNVEAATPEETPPATPPAAATSPA